MKNDCDNTPAKKPSKAVDSVGDVLASEKFWDELSGAGCWQCGDDLQDRPFLTPICKHCWASLTEIDESLYDDAENARRYFEGIGETTAEENLQCLFDFVEKEKTPKDFEQLSIKIGNWIFDFCFNRSSYYRRIGYIAVEIDMVTYHGLALYFFTIGWHNPNLEKQYDSKN